LLRSAQQPQPVGVIEFRRTSLWSLLGSFDAGRFRIAGAEASALDPYIPP
jgi:hypothetical protein